MLIENTKFYVTSPLDNGVAALLYRTAVQIGKPVKQANRVHLVVISEETEPGTVVSGTPRVNSVISSHACLRD